MTQAIAQHEETLDLQVVADGLEYPEGPVAMADGSVIVSEMAANRVSRIAPDGTRTTVAQTDAGPGGTAIGPDGALYVCCNGGLAFVDTPDGMEMRTAEGYDGGSVQRVDLTTGEVTTLYRRAGDLALHCPNDLVFDADGGFFFTDMGRTTDDGLDQGRVFYARPDGSAIDVARESLYAPNGIGLSPDGRTLFVAETITSRVWMHPVTGTGALNRGKQSPLGPLPGYQYLDSMAIAEDGTPCVGTLYHGGITAFALDGASVTYRAVPDDAVTNICFGGEDMRDTWITASNTGKLYRTRWPSAGLRLAFNG